MEVAILDENNIVTNVVMWNEENPLPEKHIHITAFCGIGFSYDGTQFVPPEPVEIKPNQVGVIQNALVEFAKQRDIDMTEIPMLLNSTNAEWRAEAERFQSLYLATWDAFYNDQPLPELIW